MFNQLISNSRWLSVAMLMQMMLFVSGSETMSVQEQDGDRMVRVADEVPAPVELIQEPPLTRASAIQSLELASKSREADPPAVRESYKHSPDLKHDLDRMAAVEVVATGYSAGKESTGKEPGHPEYGITFSGVKVVRDENSFSTIAADPKVFPIGTVLYIPGYGYGIVADTGSAIKGKKIDLYFETKDQVYKEWGKKKLEVFVIKHGSGKLNNTIWSEIEQELFPVNSSRVDQNLKVNGKTM